MIVRSSASDLAIFSKAFLMQTTTCVEPTVYAIDSTATMLKIYRLSTFDRRLQASIT